MSIGACLRAAGVARVYTSGAAVIEGVDVIGVGSEHAAVFMAAADGHLAGGAGAALVGEGELWFAATPGRGADATLVLDDAASLPEVLAEAAARVTAPVPETVVVRLDIDFGAEAPLGTEPRVPEPPADRIEAPPDVVERIRGARRPVVLAGPGVVRAGHVAALHAVAAAGSLGVLNTWGAKGIYDWRSRHHLATAGLQERDFELAGFADADLVVATGIDPAESPPEAWQLTEWVEVEPAALDDLSERFARPHTPIEPVPLRRLLGEAVAAWWASDTQPLAPARAVAAMSDALGPRGLVAADPGVAGLWVARTFATTHLGSVAVPARAGTEGWAAACALVALLRDPARRVLAGVDKIDPVTAEIVDVARRRGLPLVVEVWDPEAPTRGTDAHREALESALAAGASQVLEVSVDLSHTDVLADIAGPVVAWRQSSSS